MMVGGRLMTSLLILPANPFRNLEFGTAWASVWWNPFSHRKFRAFNFQNQVCALPRCIWLQVQNSPLEEQLQIFACPSSPIHEPTQTLSVFSLPQDIGHFPTTWTYKTTLDSTVLSFVSQDPSRWLGAGWVFRATASTESIAGRWLRSKRLSWDTTVAI